MDMRGLFEEFSEARDALMRHMDFDSLCVYGPSYFEYPDRLDPDVHSVGFMSLINAWLTNQVTTTARAHIIIEHLERVCARATAYGIARDSTMREALLWKLRYQTPVLFNG